MSHLALVTKVDRRSVTTSTSAPPHSRMLVQVQRLPVKDSRGEVDPTEDDLLPKECEEQGEAVTPLSIPTSAGREELFSPVLGAVM